MPKTFLKIFFTTLLMNQVKAQSLNNELPPVSSLLSGVPSRCVGFGSGGLRMSALAVYEKNSDIFYMGSANGGVLKTTDGGYTAKFVFDKEGSSNIGALAVSQKNPDVVWVGTGEAWQRNSVGGGDGIYKSTDGGKSWKNMGLGLSYSIGKIVIHPTDDNIVFAAVLGSPWGYGPDRGIYKTKDGGKSWGKVLYTDEKSAGTEVIVDPKNPNNMLAALWDHVHRPYGWFESGPGSGIYRSTDGGEHWTKITNGLPPVNFGRIAIDYFLKDPKEVVAAIEVARPYTGYYRSSDGGKTWREVPAYHLNEDDRSHNGMYRPYYNHIVKFHPSDINRFYYGNAQHFTKDGGKTFKGGAGDDHGLWIDPRNPDHVIACSDIDGVNNSWGLTDSGSVTKKIKVNLPPLDQVYGVGYDMRKLYKVMGNMQDFFVTVLGPTQSIRNELLGREDMEMLTGGSEAGTAMADPEDWQTIYCTGIAFDLARVDLKTGKSKSLFTDEQFPGKSIGYAIEKEFPEYSKLKTKFRANWNPPLLISGHNHKTIYFGTNFLLKSNDRGDHWEVISPDLTHDNPALQVPDGAVYRNNENSYSRSYQTIRAISESPLQETIIWAGTDDGYVQLTRDGGKTWNNVTKNITGIPEYCWISSVQASRYKEGRAYITANNYRNFDLNTHIYVTEDFGESWKKINGNIPPGQSCNVIREGRVNSDLLYLGTESSLFISLDRGNSWDRYQDFDEILDSKFTPNYLPTVRISDLQIHPREYDLIIATHGRGVWIMNARALEEMNAGNRAKDVHFTKPGNVYLFPLNGGTLSGGHNGRFDLPQRFISGKRNTQPGSLFSYYLKYPVAVPVTITITDSSGKAVNDRGGKKPLVLKGSGRAGLNAVQWYARNIDLSPGSYRAVLTINGKEYTQTFIAEDVSNEVLPSNQLFNN